ncbi:carboxypeptidase-like regulatory domain-containing protein [Pontibacter russatus]|uniref:carboxypeptidase-like regulatory domain-containing protein n=1 Tax=Pontibacter russatus TaxID=2694929 RepID=UPI00137A7918|nr:carboxypeptidase-like regulatory domain-containing protein [Pontibacter russatus]
MIARFLCFSLLSISMLAALSACNSGTTSGATSVQVEAGDIGGVVTGPNGPEAGVWVIAETNDLPTRFAKIVVTDEEGRYLIPDLPGANYAVWVRGYGLVDSPKRPATPGQSLDLKAVVAPSPQAAAQYYPAGYWFSLLEVPDKSKFPGTGPDGNGISPGITSQAKFLTNIKSGTCLACHQLGSKGTRELQESLGNFASSEDAWERRLKSGQAGAMMTSALHQVGREEMLRMFSDWTDRIKAGELPPTPQRPKGIERNVVITQWDWADPKAYLHDLVSTDRRNPTVNANGALYGALEASADYLPVLDPISHEASRIPLTVRDPNTPSISGDVLEPSPYWGMEAIWDSKTNVHNPMMDAEGNVWITAAVRPADNPDCCRMGSDHPSAKLFPLEKSSRHLGLYNPKTKKYTTIGTCFSTHHLMFAEDENNTLWTSGGGEVIGWLNTKKFLETGDEEISQGWTALILDTNGNGKRDAYVEPDKPLDPKKDKRIAKGIYSVAPAPDGSVWGSSLGYPGAVIRLYPGSNPPETALVEYYELPLDENGEPIKGFSPRGMDIDRNGVAWVALASGHLASFDRRKCGTLNGPDATGQHCPEGWTFYTEPLPQLKGVDYEGSAESSYYTWVDQFNTFGLGENIPINTGNESEALLALKDGEWAVFRVPYPLGFYTKWMDGRIDDPNGGWKGRGIWATVSTRAPFHMEGGKGTTSKVFKFQLRPDPLAR